MDEDESPGMMLIEEQARRRAERHELEEQARRRREAHLSWPRSLTWERRREHNIMPGLEEHIVPAFAGQRDISRARLRHQQACPCQLSAGGKAPLLCRGAAEP